MLALAMMHNFDLGNAPTAQNANVATAKLILLEALDLLDRSGDAYSLAACNIALAIDQIP